MKPNTLKNILIPSSLLFLCTFAFAQSGGQGGGVGIPESDFIVLKDLSKKACDLKGSSTFLEEYGLVSEINTILSELSKVNSYMAFQVKDAVKDLNWCLTESDLVSVKSTDRRSLLVSYDPEVQIAIRDLRFLNTSQDSKRVYLDLKKFRKMRPNKLILGQDQNLKYNQAMLVVHEALHTFLPKDMEDRNEMLRMLTRRIYLNYSESKDPKKTIEGRKVDLDAVITATHTEASFESTRIAEEIDVVAGYPAVTTERRMAEAAGILARESTDLNGVLSFVVDQLKRASILGFSPFVEDFFPAKHVSSRTSARQTYVSEAYLFDVAVRQSFKSYVEGVDKITWTELGDGYKPADRHESNEWKFGSCVHRQTVEVVSEVVQAWGPLMLLNQHLRTQYVDRHEFSPNYGRAAKPFVLGIATPNLYVKANFTFGLNTVDNAVDGNKLVDQFDQKLSRFLEKVKYGFCDDSSSRAMKIFKNEIF